jgi:hypothetical protein
LIAPAISSGPGETEGVIFVVPAVGGYVETAVHAAGATARRRAARTRIEVMVTPS